MTPHRAAIIVAALALLVASAARSARPPASAPPGSVIVREALKVGDKLIPAGTYVVHAESGPRGTEIVLLRDGAEVARELSLKPYRQPKKPAKSVWVRKDTRDEKALRVYYQDGIEVRFAVFPIAG